uniref:Protein kinase domain-containing protein n=1 Tax=Aegilops tauschii subsp. strangulata TaxID=200361 RepID=A0A453NC18_AEGTS
MTAYGRVTTQSQTGMKYLQHLSSRIMSLMCTTCHQLLCKMQQPYTPPFLFADSFSGFVQGLASYSVSLVATENATLTPILNAMEMYLVEPITEVATDSGDARAMMSIQENFGVEKNWMGDPCAPKAFAWIGLTCSYPPAHASKITALNVSSFGLAGTISTDFGDLNALQYLDLSSNDLYGTIPDSLQKSQNGTLSLRVGNNANICANGTACGSSRKKINGALLAAIVIPIVAVIAIFVVLFLLLRQKLKGKDKRKATGPEDESALLENREFSYRELKYITSNYSQEIGKGGFGAVFLGYLKNGNSVAVKVRSDSSSQGGKEFLAEARHLTRIHHKNLVSLIGYCKDKNHLALVYVYMPKGNLQNHLRGSTSKPLTWEQRLHIALDAAQGLEYLHIACKPALIHRDVKSTNILLTTDLGAKIADFGLTKAFGDSKTHITTEPAGTMGYLDPDVSVHVGEWVQQSLDHGAMESIVDARMVGDYDMNSVWKAAGLALHCKLEVSRERPTMAEVVAQLKECLELENRLDGRQRSLGSNFPREGSALEAEEEQQGGDIQAVAAGPAMR